jgi:hypothetical protein
MKHNNMGGESPSRVKKNQSRRIEVVSDDCAEKRYKSPITGFRVTETKFHVLFLHMSTEQHDAAILMEGLFKDEENPDTLKPFIGFYSVRVMTYKDLYTDLGLADQPEYQKKLKKLATKRIAVEIQVKESDDYRYIDRTKIKGYRSNYLPKTWRIAVIDDIKLEQSYVSNYMTRLKILTEQYKRQDTTAEETLVELLKLVENEALIFEFQATSLRKPAYLYQAHNINCIEWVNLKIAQGGWMNESEGSKRYPYWESNSFAYVRSYLNRQGRESKIDYIGERTGYGLKQIDFSCWHRSTSKYQPGTVMWAKSIASKNYLEKISQSFSGKRIENQGVEALIEAYDDDRCENLYIELTDTINISAPLLAKFRQSQYNYDARALKRFWLQCVAFKQGVEQNTSPLSKVTVGIINHAILPYLINFDVAFKHIAHYQLNRIQETHDQPKSESDIKHIISQRKEIFIQRSNMFVSANRNEETRVEELLYLVQTLCKNFERRNWLSLICPAWLVFIFTLKSKAKITDKKNQLRTLYSELEEKQQRKENPRTSKEIMQDLARITAIHTGCWPFQPTSQTEKKSLCKTEYRSLTNMT